jgi:putative Mg2+ transporter-C (MgtC) family protein
VPSDSPLHPPFWIQVAVSIACGFIVGLERQLRGKPAGVRTCILVCVGTATFMRLGVMMDHDRSDPTRVLGQIVTGIGFLGGGLILTKDGLIMGVTSASVIWVLAAVGSLIGVNRYADALAVSLVMVFVLLGVETLERGFKAFRRGVHSRSGEPLPPDSE